MYAVKQHNVVLVLYVCYLCASVCVYIYMCVCVFVVCISWLVVIISYSIMKCLFDVLCVFRISNATTVNATGHLDKTHDQLDFALVSTKYYCCWYV